MGLADDVIAINKSGQAALYDDEGLPTPKNTKLPPLDYMVARIIKRNPYMYIDPEDDRIYIGKTRIEENAREVAKLSNIFNDYCRSGRYMLVWNRLHEVLPRLDRSKIWVASDLLWNMTTGQLEEQEPKENHI